MSIGMSARARAAGAAAMRIALSTCAGMLIAMSACAATRDRADAVVWTLRDVARVGGHATGRVGAPRFIDADEAIVFDGAHDGIFVPANPLAGWPAFTIEARFRPAGSGGEEQRFLHLEDEHKQRVLLETRLRDGYWSLDTFMYRDADRRLTLLDRTKRHPADRWYWVALVYDGARMSSYVNGELELSGDVSFAPMTRGRTSIGVRQNRVSWFRGAIAELRFTPAALPADRLRR